MILDTEERLAYFGYRHMNVACRDINDEEEADVMGLERILYGVGFLAITGLTAISGWEEDAVADDDSDGLEEPHYEVIASELNPFDYQVEDEFAASMQYTVDVEEANEFENLPIGDEVPFEDADMPDESMPWEKSAKRKPIGDEELTDSNNEEDPEPVLDILDFLPPITKAS